MFTFPFPWMNFAPSATGATEAPIQTTETVVDPAESAIEERVVAEVASYGKQLGILAEALLEIADERPGRGVERLRSLVNRIEIVKSHYRRALEDKAEEAFDALLAADPPAAERLVAALEQRVVSARGDRELPDPAAAG
jgi:hypothetical protein